MSHTHRYGSQNRIHEGRDGEPSAAIQLPAVPAGNVAIPDGFAGLHQESPCPVPP